MAARWPLALALAAGALLAPAAVATLATPAAAQDEESLPRADRPALLMADEIVYERDAELVTARGSVEVSQDDRVLLADRLTYRLRDGEITASGHVAVVEPTGEVFFADEITLSDDLRRGVAQRIGMLLEENARLAAMRGEKQGDITRLDRAVYSPCDVCAEGGGTPLWRLRAMEVVHDRQSNDITYHNAWLEFLGVPIAYTPYFRHPDPTVERRSGLLAPVLGRGDNLGTSAQIPYFYVISPQEDVTVTPMYTSREGPVLIAEHRRRFTNGLTLSQGSITRDSTDDTRWHINASGEFHLDEVWRAGYEAERASDDTYLRRYGFPSDDAWLTTHPYLLGLTSRTYVSVEGFALQSLREEIEDDELPLVLPWAQFSHVSENDRFGGRWLVDASALALTRSDGTDTARLSSRVGWEMPITTSSGQLITTSLSMRADGYRIADQEPGEDTDFVGRLVPEASVEWRYPFVSAGGGVQQVIEPIVLAAATLDDLNNDKIPNEDSLDQAFDASNLFRTDRFTGLDRVEEGARINYGLSYSISSNGFRASSLVGQVYRFDESEAFPEGSGLNDNFSDYVGLFTFGLGRRFDLRYRLRLDDDDLDVRFSDLGATLSMDPVRLRVDHIYADALQQEGLGERQELYAEAQVALTETWTASAYTRYDLDDGAPLLTGAALGYEDECFAVLLTWENDRTQDRDVEAGQSVGLRFVFKTLGEVGL